MEQVIFGGQFSSVGGAANLYIPLFGAGIWQNAIADSQQIVSTSGKIKNLRVKLDGAPGAGKHYDFTLMVNGAPSALTLEIADAAISGSNMVNEIDVVAGDLVSLGCDPDNTPTARNVAWTSMFEGATANESLILGTTGGGVLLSTADRYVRASSGRQTARPAENDVRQICPTSGIMKNFYVEISPDPGTDPDAYRLTVRLNGATVAQSLIITITADATTGNDLAHNLAVVAGDVLTIMSEPLNAPTNHVKACWGMTFVADTDGESLVLGGELDPLSNATEYSHLASGVGLWTANENERYQLGQECTLKKLYVLLENAPGAGKSYTFTLRKPGNGQADGNLTVPIADAATTGNDTVNEDAIVNDDYVDLESTPAGAPAPADAYWGLVSYRAPPVGLENKSAGMAAKMIAGKLI